MSMIPPAGAPEMIPVMSSLEILVEAISVTAFRMEKIRLQHSSYLGLDSSMNWKHAALVIKRSQGEGEGRGVQSQQ